MILPAKEKREVLVTCRAGLEKTVAKELRELNVDEIHAEKRAVFFRTDLAGIYRVNMAIRSAINVLVPLRTFNARTYELLYFQSRKTNWHKLFEVDKNIRIDVNGGSDKLRNSQYVTHRVKDGIVDTFRKLKDGIRPSISKDNPEIHLMVHLDGTKVTLCLDTSGIPLFKRGYRTIHGIAPLKEDLAAGMLLLSDWDQNSSLSDPMCGSGTFLYEAAMIASNTPPNLDRSFGFEHTLDYDPDIHAEEREKLRKQIKELPDSISFNGIEKDEETFETASEICRTHFSHLPIQFYHSDFRHFQDWPENGFIISNPPYGLRTGINALLPDLYRDLGETLKAHASQAAIYTANDELKGLIAPTPHKELTLFNGRLEGRLMLFNLLD